MADVFNRPHEFAEPKAAEPNDLFLLREGLDLLAAFRTIEDANVRAAIIQFVKSLAAADRSSGA